MVQGHWLSYPTSWSVSGVVGICAGGVTAAPGGAEPDGRAGCDAQRVCLLPAA